MAPRHGDRRRKPNGATLWVRQISVVVYVAAGLVVLLLGSTAALGEATPSAADISEHGPATPAEEAIVEALILDDPITGKVSTEAAPANHDSSGRHLTSTSCSDVDSTHDAATQPPEALNDHGVTTTSRVEPLAVPAAANGLRLSQGNWHYQESGLTIDHMPNGSVSIRRTRGPGDWQLATLTGHPIRQKEFGGLAEPDKCLFEFSCDPNDCDVGFVSSDANEATTAPLASRRGIAFNPAQMDVAYYDRRIRSTKRIRKVNHFTKDSKFALLLDLESRTNLALTVYWSASGRREDMKAVQTFSGSWAQSFVVAVSLRDPNTIVTIHAAFMNGDIPVVYGAVPLLHEHQSPDANAFDFHHLDKGSIRLLRSSRVPTSCQPVVFTQRSVKGTDRCVIEFEYDHVHNGNCQVGFTTDRMCRKCTSCLYERRSKMMHVSDTELLFNTADFQHPNIALGRGAQTFALMLDQESKTFTLYSSETGRREDMHVVEMLGIVGGTEYWVTAIMRLRDDDLTIRAVYFNDDVPSVYAGTGRLATVLTAPPSTEVTEDPATTSSPSLQEVGLSLEQSNWRYDVGRIQFNHTIGGHASLRKQLNYYDKKDHHVAVYTGRSIRGTDNCVFEFICDPNDCNVGFVSSQDGDNDSTTDRSIAAHLLTYAFRPESMHLDYRRRRIKRFKDPRRLREVGDHYSLLHSPKYPFLSSKFALMLDLKERKLTLFWSVTARREHMQIVETVGLIEGTEYFIAASFTRAEGNVIIYAAFMNDDIPAVYGVVPLLHEHQSADANAFDFHHYNDGSIKLVMQYSHLTRSCQPVFFTQRSVKGTDRCLIEFEYDHVHNGNCQVGFTTAGVNRSLSGCSYDPELRMMYVSEEELLFNTADFKIPSIALGRGAETFALMLDLGAKTFTLYWSETGQSEDMRVVATVGSIRGTEYWVTAIMRLRDDYLTIRSRRGHKLMIRGVYFNADVPSVYSGTALIGNAGAGITVPIASSIRGEVRGGGISLQHGNWHYDVDQLLLDQTRHGHVSFVAKFDRFGYERIVHFMGGITKNDVDKCIIEFSCITDCKVAFMHALGERYRSMQGDDLNNFDAYIFNPEKMKLYHRGKEFHRFTSAAPHPFDRLKFALLLNLHEETLTLYWSETGHRDDMKMVETVGNIQGMQWSIVLSMCYPRANVTIYGVFKNGDIPAVYDVVSLLHVHQSSDANAFDFHHLDNGSIRLLRSSRVPTSCQPVVFTQRSVKGTDRCVIEFEYDHVHNGNCQVGFTTDRMCRKCTSCLYERRSKMMYVSDTELLFNTADCKHPNIALGRGAQTFALMLDQESKTFTLYWSETGRREDMHVVETLGIVGGTEYWVTAIMRLRDDDLVIRGVYFNDDVPPVYKHGLSRG